jgi:hypothetical protein
VNRFGAEKLSTASFGETKVGFKIREWQGPTPATLEFGAGAIPYLLVSDMGIQAA